MEPQPGTSKNSAKKAKRKLKAEQWRADNPDKAQQDAEKRIERGSQQHRRHALNQFRRYLSYHCEGCRLIVAGLVEEGREKKVEAENLLIHAIRRMKCSFYLDELKNEMKGLPEETQRYALDELMKAHFR